MGSSKWTYVKTKNWVVISLHSMKIEVLLRFYATIFSNFKPNKQIFFFLEAKI